VLVLFLPVCAFEVSRDHLEDKLYVKDIFFDKEHILYHEDTKYTQSLQQRIVLVALQMHTSKQRKKN
jgi:quinol monooxygenase YgiN